MTASQYAAVMRNELLDAHERAEIIAEQFQRAETSNAGPEVIDQLRRLIVMRAYGEAALLMKLAHVFDRLAEVAGDNEPL